MIYDHEREADAPRDRPVADWGGDDLFTSMPRRFSRHAEGRPRRHAGVPAGSHAVRRGGGPDGHRPAARAAVGAPAEAPTPGAVRMPEPLPMIVSGADAVDAATLAVGPGRRPTDAQLDEDVLSPDRFDAPAPARRTVAITGHPGGAATPVRRRPGPSVHDRLSARPDRIAAWAFGLGITLVLIAVGTADAAPI